MGWSKTPIEASQARVGKNGESYNTLKARLDAENERVTTQLAQNEESIKSNLTFANKKRRPLITFLDDDTTMQTYTRLRPIFYRQNVPLSVACITGRFDNPNHMSAAQVKEVYDAGWEVLGHAFTHPTGSGAGIIEYTDYARLEDEIYYKCKLILEKMGIRVDGFVYPQSGNNATIREITRTYYTYAFANTGVASDGAMDSMRIPRISIGSYTEGNPTINGNSEKNTFAYYKACVDYVVATNGWLVFMLHAAAQTSADDQIIEDVIEYIKSINVEIVNARDGYQAFGNKVFVGDLDSAHFFVERDGTINYPLATKKGKDNSVVNSTLLSAFDFNRKTEIIISNPHAANAGFPEIGAGILTTHYYHQTNLLHNYQEYHVYASKNKYRRKAKSDGTWDAWILDTTYAIYPSNHFTPSNILADFPIGVSVNRLFGGSLAGAPSATQGTLLTHNYQENCYQEFQERDTNNEYRRFWDYTSSSWSTWALRVNRAFGTTAQRPTTNLYIGMEYKDTTLKKTVTWYGTAWYDETGTVV